MARPTVLSSDRPDRRHQLAGEVLDGWVRSGYTHDGYDKYHYRKQIVGGSTSQRPALSELLVTIAASVQSPRYGLWCTVLPA